MIQKLFNEPNQTKINQRSRKLILASGSINACANIVILMVAARTNSIEDTGILTIAFAIAKLFLNIGKYGTRNYQVTESTDIKFTEWFVSRVITVTIMMISVTVYMIYQVMFDEYSWNKVVIVLLICVLYAGECIEDIYTGFYQQKNRLDISSVIQILRWCCVLLVFIGILIMYHNLLWACIASALVSTLAVYLFATKTMPLFYQGNDKIRWSVVKKILVDCFPLCVTNFMLIYISNASKYTLDSMYGLDVQAYFGFVSMPIFAISLFSGFVFQPQLVNMSKFWQKGDYSYFNRIILRQLIYITILSVGCIVLGSVMGIPVLSVLYGVSGLEEYKNVFIILLIGGAGSAIINFLTAVLVIFRKQKIILAQYIVAGGCIWLTIKYVTSNYGVIGAALDTTVGTLALALSLVVTYMYILYESQKVMPNH